MIFTKDEIMKQVNFQEKYFVTEIIMINNESGETK